MDKVKTYTAEQLESADRLLKMLSALPEDKRRIVVMIANAFMDGMTAQEHLSTTKKDQNATEARRLSLLEFAEVFLPLPESAKREVLGYAKCLYATQAAKEQTKA